jgi:diguanylate cyclase (GGDEF)-like protein
MLTFFTKNLGWRIQFTLSLFVFITAVPIGLIWYKSSEQVLIKTIEKLYHHSSEVIKSQLDEFFTEANTVYAHQARLGIDLAETITDRDNLLEHIANILNHHHDIDYFYFANNEGALLSLGKVQKTQFIRLESDQPSAGPISSYNADFNGNGEHIINQNAFFDPRTRDWYLRALEHEQPVWSDIYLGAIENILGISLSKVLKDTDGKVLGVWGLDLTLNSVTQELHKSKLSPNSTVLLMDVNGEIIASTNDKHAPKDGKLLNVASGQTPLLQTIWPTVSPAEYYKNTSAYQFRYQGEQWVCFTSYYPLSDSRDILMLFITPVSDFTSEFIEAKHFAIIITVLLVGIAIYYGSYGTKYILTPIIRLTHSAEAISQGKWNQQIHLDRQDELGQLARSFNKMVEHLKSYIDQLNTHQDETARLNALLEKQNLKLEERVQARTLSLTEANQKLQQLAYYDPLTNVANRRYFWDEFERQLHQPTGPAESPLHRGWLFILDIDNFKQFNDKYGHVVGDDALKHFSDVCTSCLSDQDMIGRVGGEEFAIWSNVILQTEAQAIADAILYALSSQALFKTENNEAITISASIGVIPCQYGDKNCYARADKQLYKAKAAGKSQVCMNTDRH